MRPYLAILKDSFRETLSSKVLWILLAVITIFLLLLAGISVKSTVYTGLRRNDVHEWTALAERLRDARNDKAAGRVRDRLPREVQNRLRAFAKDGTGHRQFFNDLRQAIDNDLRQAIDNDLGEPVFATAIKMPVESLSPEGRKLVERGPDTLPDLLKLRLNRLVLEAALPQDVKVSPQAVFMPTYMGIEPDELTFTAEELFEIVKGALQFFVIFFVSVLGTFVAILVTAPIVPRMFEPGAIDLLLSKPVNRSLVFLSKFLGGCVFTLVNAGYLIAGIWLVVGLRFDIWSDSLLLSLPVYLFLFMIYYAVSAAAGVLFRGGIVSVMIVVGFWFQCFVVGALKEGIEQFALNGARIQSMTMAGNTLLAAGRSGSTYAWSSKEANWTEVFKDANPPRSFQAAISRRAIVGFPFLGPYYDDTRNQIVAVTKPVPVILRGGQPGRLFVGGADTDWSRVGGTILPISPRELFLVPPKEAAEGRRLEAEILIAGPAGLYRFRGDVNKPQQSFKIFGIDFGNRAEFGRFESARPEGTGRWPTPFAVTLDPAGGQLFVYGEGRLTRLVRGENHYEVLGPEVDLKTDQLAELAVAGNRLLVVLGDGEFRLLDTATLKTVKTLQPLGARTPKTAIASPDGKYLAVLNHRGDLWLYDVDQDRRLTGGPADSDDHYAIAFTPSGTLLVGGDYLRVSEYRLPGLEPAGRYHPPLTRLQSVYRYLVLPIYTVFPKPGELNEVIVSLFEDSDALPVSGQQDDDLGAEKVTINIWRPILSNVAFLVVLLTVTCVYVARKDF